MVAMGGGRFLGRSVGNSSRPRRAWSRVATACSPGEREDPVSVGRGSARGVWTRLALGTALWLIARPAVAASCDEADPWSHLPDSADQIARPRALALLGAALVPPAVMAPSGLDHEARLLVQRSLGGRHDAEPVSMYAPHVLLAGATLTYVASVVGSACEPRRTTAAILQGSLLTLGLVSGMKWGVGRGFPNAGEDPTAADRLEHPENARQFAPFQQGLGAFPSGHTAVVFAAAGAVRGVNAHWGWARYVAYPIAAGVAFGMWYGDHHWTSDIVSGALMGEALGGAVGNAFADHTSQDGLAMVAFVSGSTRLVGLTGRW